MRNYLREMQKGPFDSYARAKLLSIDRDILKAYQSSADKALREKRFDAAKAVFRQIIAEYEGTLAAEDAKAGLRGATIGGYNWAALQAAKANNFEGAKSNYRKIVAEFPDSDEAQSAQGELQKLVPVAVKFYKVEGDKNFRPGDQGQFLVPQIKAREFYEKMYKEDPDGPSAAEALLRWGEGLATESKAKEAIQKYDAVIEKWPNSPLLVEAMYAKAFALGANPANDDKTIALMREIVRRFPQSDKAAESLWHCAFYLAYGQNNFTEAKTYLEWLRRDYPNYIRTKFVDEEMRNYAWRIENVLKKPFANQVPQTWK